MFGEKKYFVVFPIINNLRMEFHTNCARTQTHHRIHKKVNLRSAICLFARDFHFTFIIMFDLSR